MMRKLEFYKEGSILLYFKRTVWELIYRRILDFFIFNLFFLGVIGNLYLIGNQYTLIPIWTLLGAYLFSLLLLAFIFPKISHKLPTYYIKHIYNDLYYERFTKESEGFNPENKLTNFDIIRFIDGGNDRVKIYSRKKLPWGKKEIKISKEYLPYKKEVLHFLNENFALDFTLLE